MSRGTQAGLGCGPWGGCQKVIAQGDGRETLRSDWWKPLSDQRLLFWQEIFHILCAPLLKVDHTQLLTRLFLAVGVHDAVKRSDDVIDFRGVFLSSWVPSRFLLGGCLLGLAEDLVEHAKSPFLLLGSSVLGRNGCSLFCSKGWRM